MMERRKLNESAGEPPKDTRGGLYFAQPAPVATFSSGCTVLDCVLSGGGGWARDRVLNIVGDKSTGKTLLAIEGTANFHREYPRGSIRYREVEDAFDIGYAETLGLPAGVVDMPEDRIFTVKEMHEDVENFIETKKDGPGLYILDSLDALSDAAELEGEFGKASYGTGKAKDMSQMFRRLIQRTGEAQVTIMIISQVRDNIGVTFGRQTTRSGGRALDFYASQVIFLAQMGKIKKTIGGVERPIGVDIKALCDKNKVSMPFRSCEFPIYFGFGTDDVAACLDFLLEVKRLDAVGISVPKKADKEEEKPEKDDEKKKRKPSPGAAAATAMLKEINSLDDAGYSKERERLRQAVIKVWNEIEDTFRPPRRKYNDA